MINRNLIFVLLLCCKYAYAGGVSVPLQNVVTALISSVAVSAALVAFALLFLRVLIYGFIWIRWTIGSKSRNMGVFSDYYKSHFRQSQPIRRRRRYRKLSGRYML